MAISQSPLVGVSFFHCSSPEESEVCRVIEYKLKCTEKLVRENKLNTFERIIGNDNNNKSYIYEKPLGKKNITHQQSSVGGLLKYENTPKGYDIELNKPTQSKYSDIVKSINNNKNNKVFNKPANRLFNENKQSNHIQLI